MTEIKKLQDVNGNQVYPQTHIAAVVGSGGKDLNAVLNDKADKENTYTKTQVDNLLVPADTDIQVVSVLPQNGSPNTIYRVPGTNSYSDYGWDGTQFVKLATHDNTLTDGILDVSEINSGDTYSTLSEALEDIPQENQKGGMSIKFIDNDTTTYVQYRLVSPTWDTTPENWIKEDVLYTSRGQNTDGSMTQEAITDELTTIDSATAEINQRLSECKEWVAGVKDDIKSIISKMLHDDDFYMINRQFEDVVDNNTRQLAYEGMAFHDTIDADNDSVITNLSVEMNGEDITKQTYLGPFSAEITGHATGNTEDNLTNGDSYSSGTITPDAGYGIASIEVQIGDDVLENVVENNEVTIPHVNGDVVAKVNTAYHINEEPFLSRITANGLTLANDRALLKGINGNTLAWNQKVNNGDFSNGTSGWIISGNITKVIEDGALKMTIPANLGAFICNYGIAADTLPVGHLLYYRITYKGDGNFGTSYIGFNNISTCFEATSTYKTISARVGVIGGATVQMERQFGLFGRCEANTTIYLKEVVVIDLTQMFGAGNEPTLAEFEALYPLGSYTADAGRLIDFKGETLRSTKTAARVWNQLVKIVNRNQEIVTGVRLTSSADTGLITISGTATSSGGRSLPVSNTDIPIVSGHKYYILNEIAYAYITKYGESSTFASLGTDTKIYTASTDISNGYLGFGLSNGVTYNTSGYFKLFDLTAMFGEGNEPSTAAEFEAIMEKLGNPTTEEEFNTANLLQDITINPTAMYGYLNGEGEAVQIFPSGMRSAGSVFDQIYKDNGKWYAKINVGSVEINPANVSWSQWGTNRVYLHTFTAANSADMCKATSSAANRVSDRMTILASGSMASLAEGAKGYVAINGNLIYITTADYNDRANLATFGINYEFAIPRTYLLTDEWQGLLNTAYQVTSGGMEIVLPENGSEPTTSPAKMAIQYGTDGSENN